MAQPASRQHEIEAAGYRAVVTECGAGLRLLELDGHRVVAGFPAEVPAPGGRGQLLVPWPNRVADGRYTFGWRELQLPVNEPELGHALHGLVRWLSWELRQHDAARVVLGCRLMAQPGYPWTLDVEVDHSVSSAGLRTTVTAVNLGESPAPVAFGAHPYLTVGDDPVDAWELTVPAATRLLLDDRKIPVGHADVSGTAYDLRAGRLLGDLVLDDAFTDLARGPDGLAVVTLRHPGTGRSAELWMDAEHDHVQVFTGEGTPGARTAVAVEPMTAAPNAFGTGEVGVLAPAGEPGDRRTVAWGLRATAGAPRSPARDEEGRRPAP